MIAHQEGGALRIDVATAFDCPFDGLVPLDDVKRVFQSARSIAPHAEIALCDTTDRADQISVRTRFALLSEADSLVNWAFHGHDTFGMGIANAFAAYSAGVRVFDGAAAGLGGCPFAPGASGNTAMEDLVYVFSRGGIESGIDIDGLLTVADRIGCSLGAELRAICESSERKRATRSFTRGYRTVRKLTRSQGNKPPHHWPMTSLQRFSLAVQTLAGRIT